MYRHFKRCFFYKKWIFFDEIQIFFVILQTKTKLSNQQNTNMMKKILLLGMAVLAIGIFASCEKTEDNTPTPTIVHNELYQTYWEGSLIKRGQNGEYEWHYSYYLNLDFLSDTSVRFYGTKWLSRNYSWNVDIYKEGEWNDTLKYSFSDSVGNIYGPAEYVWRGDTTSIQLIENNSLQLKTSDGLAKFSRKERE